MNVKIVVSVLLVATIINIASSGLIAINNVEDENSGESSEMYMQQYDSAESYIELNGTLYYFENNLVANWFAANDFCRKLGMFLVAIETPEENDILVDHITSIGSADYWTALTDLAANNTFTWFTTGERALYFNWRVGEPMHDVNGTKNCVSLSYLENTIEWALRTEYSALHIICEKFPDPSTPVTTTIDYTTSTTTRPPTTTTEKNYQ